MNFTILRRECTHTNKQTYRHTMSFTHATSRYIKECSTECSRTSRAPWDMGYECIATKYFARGNKTYRVVRIHAHCYDEDTDMFVNCRGLFQVDDGILRITEVSGGALFCYATDDVAFKTREDLNSDVIAIIEKTLLKLDGVLLVSWTIDPKDADNLDATELNAYCQEVVTFSS